ncbi:type II toxin-antitoxin system VapC family toxin [Candidatus Bathyarchaeota archaeon]|nr:type II toxin-antitoxin system VapC family toxin [Candidatus Bathyarchaeota archaeon]
MPIEPSRAVLDASILIQTIVREKYTDVALKLVSMLEEIYAPSLILYEIGNALVILKRRNFITKEDAMRKFNYVKSIPTLNIKEIEFDRAIDMAIELDITLYDASYLNLALEMEAQLITADRKLYEKGRVMAEVIHASEVTL